MTERRSSLGDVLVRPSGRQPQLARLDSTGLTGLFCSSVPALTLLHTLTFALRRSRITLECSVACKSSISECCVASGGLDLITGTHVLAEKTTPKTRPRGQRAVPRPTEGGQRKTEGSSERVLSPFRGPELSSARFNLFHHTTLQLI